MCIRDRFCEAECGADPEKNPLAPCESEGTEGRDQIEHERLPCVCAVSYTHLDVYKRQDMAEEMVNYSKNNILAQAGQSMLAQANQSTQGCLLYTSRCV